MKKIMIAVAVVMLSGCNSFKKLIGDTEKQAPTVRGAYSGQVWDGTSQRTVELGVNRQDAENIYGSWWLDRDLAGMASHGEFSGHIDSNSVATVTLDEAPDCSGTNGIAGLQFSAAAVRINITKDTCYNDITDGQGELRKTR